MCMPYILPHSFVVQRSVPVHGITQLGLRSHPTGLITHEALTTTLSFVVRPFSPCHPFQAMAEPIVSHIWNPYPTFLGRVNDFQGRLYPGAFLDLGYLDPFRTQASH